VNSPSYDAIHFRLVKARGRASSHPCSGCGGSARDWSYQYNSSEELSQEGSLYSEDLTCYEPLCRKCHKTLDMELSYRMKEVLHGLGLKQIEYLATLREDDPEFAAKMRDVGKRLGAYTSARRKSDPEFAAVLARAAQKNILEAIHTTRERMSDPEFAAKVSVDRATAARVANSIRRQCECGIVAHPAAIGAHQKASGHATYVDLPPHWKANR